MFTFFRRLTWQMQIGGIVLVVAVLVVAGFLALQQFQAGSLDTLPDVETADVGGLAALFPQSEQPLGIHVIGEGEVLVTPDQAIVVLGVEAGADTADAAAAQTSETTGAVIEAIRELGIDAADIRTTGLSLVPVFPTDSGEPPQRLPTPSGYISNNTLTITVDDIELTSKVLDAALAAGANTIRSISFTLADDAQAKETALRLATLDAARKARAMASALRGSVRGLISISEEFVSVPRALAGGAEILRAGVAPGVPVEPGELRIRAVVRANFAYE